MRIVKLDENTKAQALQKLIGRGASGYGEFEKTVQDIIAEVRENGDEAVIGYEKKFDRCDLSPETLRVSKEEIEEAYASLDPALIEVMKKAAENIRVYHEKQKRTSWITTREDGVILGQKVTPIEVSGCYVPGGRAVYPSSVLMNIVPAKVAGVEKIVMCTPPGADGKAAAGTVVAADIAGPDEIYKVGGAQAIAAMAYGTQTIPKVDKITGPGNIFVATAKKLVFGDVNIDMIAGPSEVGVLADGSANAYHTAVDLLSQAEHDEIASSIMVTDDEKFALAVKDEIYKILPTLERESIARKSIDDKAAIIIAKNFDEAIDLMNDLAVEHLEIATDNAYEILPRIKHAGAIFLGHYTPEALGDYLAGPNHTLPTGGSARFFSPLGVYHFIKRSSIIAMNKKSVDELGEACMALAEAEGLTAHKKSVEIRYKK